MSRWESVNDKTLKYWQGLLGKGMFADMFQSFTAGVFGAAVVLVSPFLIFGCLFMAINSKDE